MDRPKQTFDSLAAELKQKAKACQEAEAKLAGCGPVVAGGYGKRAGPGEGVRGSIFPFSSRPFGASKKRCKRV